MIVLLAIFVIAKGWNDMSWEYAKQFLLKSNDEINSLYERIKDTRAVSEVWYQKAHTWQKIAFSVYVLIKFPLKLLYYSAVAGFFSRKASFSAIRRFLSGFWGFLRISIFNMFFAGAIAVIALLLWFFLAIGHNWGPAGIEKAEAWISSGLAIIAFFMNFWKRFLNYEKARDSGDSIGDAMFGRVVWPVLGSFFFVAVSFWLDAFVWGKIDAFVMNLIF
ncbi:MAG: hypothetical protein LBS35_12850 [Synergistaceae bacterium]|nr:hypothetical protein [Synergistaceae bacterium]